MGLIIHHTVFFSAVSKSYRKKVIFNAAKCVYSIIFICALGCSIRVDIMVEMVKRPTDKLWQKRIDCKSRINHSNVRCGWVEEATHAPFSPFTHTYTHTYTSITLAAEKPALISRHWCRDNSIQHMQKRMNNIWHTLKLAQLWNQVLSAHAPVFCESDLVTSMFVDYLGCKWHRRPLKVDLRILLIHWRLDMQDCTNIRHNVWY